MKTIIKQFNELTLQELYAILRLRNEVFVVEQNCVYQDADNKDQKATHIFIKNNDEILAYTRIFKPGEYFKNASIGRVVVNPKYRKQNLGKKIMQISIVFVLQSGFNTIEISAQTYLKKFYNELGFTHIGEEYLEDNIPHIKMIYLEKN